MLHSNACNVGNADLKELKVQQSTEKSEAKEALGSREKGEFITADKCFSKRC